MSLLPGNKIQNQLTISILVFLTCLCQKSRLIWRKIALSCQGKFLTLIDQQNLVESKRVWLSPRIIKSGLPMVANTSKAFKQLKQKCLSQKKFLWPWQVGNSLTKHQNQSPLASHAPSPQEAKKRKGRLRPQGGGILVTLVVPILAGLNQSAIASTKGDVSGGAYERGSLSYQVGCLWLISKVLTFLLDTLWLSTYCYFSLVWPVYSFGTTIYCFSVVLVYQD
ncbi:hypothetical protein EDC96DRAFT_543435 [Choanephora cucurbitarum]|nr:hypothetical protein EDC96DRAFT_543435 [Choanephora cucurbitarum]